MRISGITYISRKTHKVRNVVITLLLLFFILVVAVVVISSYVGWNLVHPPRIGIEPFSSNIVPEHRDVNFSSADKDIVLNGWLFEVKGSSKTVILAHGYGKNRLEFEEQTLDIIKGFVTRGFNVLAFDLRNSGKSGGKLTTMGFYEKNDLLGAVNYVKSLGSKQIVLMGFSTGASASIMAAAESKDISAVIADSPYSELRKYLVDGFSEWTSLPAFPFNSTLLLSMELLGGMDVDKASPRRFMVNISPRSVLLIHCRNDKEIPVENSRILYSVISKTKSKNHELWETDGDGHLGSFRKSPQEYMDRVLGFLDKVFSEK